MPLLTCCSSLHHTRAPLMFLHNQLHTGGKGHTPAYVSLGRSPLAYDLFSWQPGAPWACVTTLYFE
jgi:hypothetical protein